MARATALSVQLQHALSVDHPNMATAVTVVGSLDTLPLTKAIVEEHLAAVTECISTLKKV